MAELVKVKITLKYKLGNDLVIIYPHTIEDAVRRIEELCRDGINYSVDYKVLEK